LVHQVPCTGLTKENVGIPCIHEIRAFEGQQSPFHNSTAIGIYHHLQQEVAPIDPQLLVLEPQIVRTRDQPAGSQNCPPQTTQNNSMRREPSGFEYEATEEARDRDRNREQGQGGRRDREDAEVGRAVVEVAVVEGNRGRGRGQANMRVYQAR